MDIDKVISAYDNETKLISHNLVKKGVAHEVYPWNTLSEHYSN